MRAGDQPSFPGTSPRTGYRRYGYFAVALLLLTGLLGSSSRAADEPGTLTRIDQVRALSNQQAAQHAPVRLRGVVTYSDPVWYLLFLQDGYRGIYVAPKDVQPLAAGTVVEVTGVTDQGRYLPIVRAQQLTILNPGPLPEARLASHGELASGSQDCRRVAIDGVVRAAWAGEQHVLVEIAAAGGRFQAIIPGLQDLARVAALVDAEVRAQGVCAVDVDEGRVVRFKLLVPRVEDLLVRRAARADPFAGPVEEAHRIVPPKAGLPHRARLSGVVLRQASESSIYVRDASGAFVVRFREPVTFAPGTSLAIAGFPRGTRFPVEFEDAVARPEGTALTPEARLLAPSQLLGEEAGAELITLDARLVELTEREGRIILVCQAGDRVFEAILAREQGDGLPGSLLPGSELRLTGIGSVRADQQGVPQAFQLLLGEGADVVRLKGPPWWSSERFVMILLGLSGLGVLALLWVIALRGQVRRQTEQIRRRLVSEASLESRCRDLVENAHDIIYAHDLEGHITSWNRAGEQLLGYTADEIRGINISRIVVPEQLEQARRMTARKVEGESRTVYELDVFTRDGRRRTMEISSRLVQEPGKPPQVYGTARDVTERNEAEALLRASEERYRSLFASNPHPMWVFDTETFAFLEVNDAALAHYGYTREEFLRMTSRDIRPPEEAARLEAHVARIRTLPGHRPQGSWKHRKKDGTLIDVEVSSHALVFAGRPARLVLAHDITERLKAEEMRTRLTAILEATPDLVAISTMDGPVLYLNAAGRRLLGVGAEESIRLNDFRSDAASRHLRDEALPAAMREGSWSGETVFTTRDDKEVPVSQVIIAHRDEQGRVQFLSTIARDVRDRKQLEAQLIQAQKMEAVGTLAGGVAHDFNNLLTVINGFTDLILLELPPGDPRTPLLEEVRKSGERAATLTRQLLAFSRRQVLAPRVIDLNAVTRDVEKMLRRLIGEDVELTMTYDPALGRVKADPGQMEQVLLNLAVNARDAMPQGGQLVIQTVDTWLDAAACECCDQELLPGRYVQVMVRDTGCGMDAATKARIFEPFFTTKEQGKGTGLGLAMVYGVVKQSDGHITVESEPERGTTFRVYLPALAEECAEPPANGTRAAAPRGNETLLLVEDESMVRNMARTALRQVGYTVLEAAGGAQALELAAHHAGPITLLVTDVVMPRMSGQELAERLTKQRPELKVLYLSGYTEDAVLRHGIREETVAFLGKPFTPSALARKVREVLDGGVQVVGEGRS